MTESQLTSTLYDLLNYPSETEWIEYKQNNFKPEDIGEYISALSNSACLHRKKFGYIVWGIKDQTKKIVGTDFRPRTETVKGRSWKIGLQLI
jgi:predicted HTH transcriptional regulator